MKNWDWKGLVGAALVGALTVALAAAGCFSAGPRPNPWYD